MEKGKKVEVEVPKISTSSAETVKILATIILIIGVIGGVIMFSIGIDNNPILIISSIISIVYVVTTCALLQVIANISIQLKAIQETMPLKLVEAKAKKVENTKPAEEHVERKGISTLKVGDKVTWRKTMAICTVEDIDGNRVYVNTGFLGGHKWIPEEELIIPQE
jgi:hypothetical protein